MKNIVFAIVFICIGQSYCLAQGHVFNQAYTGKNLEQLAFPIGGIGAGMFCLEGEGAISHFSVRNTPDIFNEPAVFAAVGIKGHPTQARVLEGPVPDHKKFGPPHTGLGSPNTTWGLPRFASPSFLPRFPFATIKLSDPAVPLQVTLTGWSPFIPTDANSSSLPVGALEYHFVNTGKAAQEYVFSFNAPDFFGKKISPMSKGFVLQNDDKADGPEENGAIAFFTDDSATTVNPAGFRGGFWDAQTMAWNHVQNADVIPGEPVEHSPGASLYVPFKLKPGESKTIRLMICWYFPDTKLNMNWSGEAKDPADFSVVGYMANQPVSYYKPWYSSQFNSIGAVCRFWKTNYKDLKDKTTLFTKAFYNTTLPAVAIEAVAANLCILKSPTVLRQDDGRFWGWEGSDDEQGSCPGSCTHVYNYAQSICHLFPALERSLRETEFNVDQSLTGKQAFRANLPIRPTGHTFYAAADGQLGGIMKVYRDWHISGDSAWIKALYPKIKQSLDYCIRTWDPKHQGTIAEPHHNTYDIEFWGAEPMCTGFYAGALEAFVQLSKELNKTDSLADYQQLYHKAQTAVETSLWNGSYFRQQTQWQVLEAGDPLEAAKNSYAGAYSPEGIALLKKEGPRYQYGGGCLSDGMIGAWMANVCGLQSPVVEQKVKSHLEAVYRYNFKTDLSTHSNPQRPAYALGKEGGLLLCTWPQGGKPTLPFVYSNEVWTGIEYEVASHLIMEGKITEGLNIVKTTRTRYDGSIRNPFDEYECGHWYARAMASYALLQALTGVRYDAVTKTLYVRTQVGNFTSFLSTDTGFGNVIYQNGRATLKVAYGKIDVQHVRVAL
jgi:uncharacterized protein (DUF608 family)